jgi:RimJ/RimL family protein N-acetyltransferase
MCDHEQPVLTAEGGLILRPWRRDDAAAVLEGHNDAVIQRWHRRRLDSIEEAGQLISSWAEEWAAETRACWAVTGDSGQLLGRLSLRTLLGQGLGEVGYWVLPAARGAGAAPRAVEAATTWAFEDLGLHRIELVHSVANRASCRVAAKAGYELEGTMRSALLHADGWHDMHLHARIAGRPAAGA